MYEITKTIYLDAAHFLREYEQGKDEPLHGHHWRIDVGVSFEAVDERGISCDFLRLGKLLQEHIFTHFDHQLFNTIPPFDTINPTAENIAKYIFDIIEKTIPEGKKLWVRVWETSTSSAKYSKE